jgi:hypothetical protein
MTSDRVENPEFTAFVDRVNEQLRNLQKVVECPRALECVALPLQVPSRDVRSQWEWMEILYDSLFRNSVSPPGSRGYTPDIPSSELEALVEMRETVWAELKRMGPDPTPERRTLHSVWAPDAASLATAFRHSIWLPDPWPAEGGSAKFEALIETPHGITEDREELIAAGEPKAYESRSMGSRNTIDLRGQWGTTLENFSPVGCSVSMRPVPGTPFPTLQWSATPISGSGVVVLVPKLVVHMSQREHDLSELIEMACSLREFAPAPVSQPAAAGTVTVRTAKRRWWRRQVTGPAQ